MMVFFNLTWPGFPLEKSLNNLQFLSLILSDSKLGRLNFAPVNWRHPVLNTEMWPAWSNWLRQRGTHGGSSQNTPPLAAPWPPTKCQARVATLEGADGELDTLLGWFFWMRNVSEVLTANCAEFTYAYARGILWLVNWSYFAPDSVLQNPPEWRVPCIIRSSEHFSVEKLLPGMLWQKCAAESAEAGCRRRQEGSCKVSIFHSTLCCLQLWVVGGQQVSCTKCLLQLLAVARRSWRAGSAAICQCATWEARPNGPVFVVQEAFPCNQYMKTP